MFGGDDDHIPLGEIQAFDDALPVEHEIRVYDGAPHSFFDRRAEQYADESQDAWERILGFITKREN
ncbi:MAG: dienelactone hydrolase family protein [Solirubrobacteraceae bacterium]